MTVLTDVLTALAIIGVPTCIARLVPPCRTPRACLLEVSVFGLALASLEYVVTTPLVVRGFALAMLIYAALRIVQRQPFPVTDARSGGFELDAIGRSAHLWPMLGLGVALLARRMEVPSVLSGTGYFLGIYGGYSALQSRAGGKLFALLTLSYAAFAVVFE